MALIEINTNPSRRDLAWFGLILMAFLGVVGAFAGRATGNIRVSQVIWLLGITLATAYYAVPALRRPIFVGWMYAAYPIGYVVSHVLLGIIYFGLLTPIGWLLRAFGHDPMERRIDDAAPTYWIKRDALIDVARYFRQF